MKRTIAKPLAFVSIVALGLGLSVTAGGQTSSAGPGIHDRAGMFSAEGIKRAELGLSEAKSLGSVEVLIETLPTLGDRSSLREMAMANARTAKLQGLSIAIARKEHKLDIEPSGPTAQRLFTKPELELIKQAFSRSFQKGDYDTGLLDAVAEIRRAAMKVGVRDHARLFSPSAVHEADAGLEAIRRKTRWGVIIETVESLDGAPLREVAVANARAAQVHGLYILIAKQDRKVYAQPSKSAESVFTREKIRSLENTLTAAFKEKAFDRGLSEVVEGIRSETTLAVASAPPPPEPDIDTASSPPIPAAPRRQPQPLPEPQPGGEREHGLPAPGKVAMPTVSPPMILLGGGVLLLVLWMIFSRARTGSSQQAQPMSPQGMAGGGPAQSFGPRSAPGYGPGPGPPPGGGYGQGGYGYGGGAPMPPPQGGGAGGFMSGALGGAAGAIAGNILYDKFGRPHEAPGEGAGAGHSPGGGFPHQAGPPFHSEPGPDADANYGSPPTERYDPNAGVGADWGTPDQDQPTSDAGQDGSGGDWSGGADEAASPGGDWGGAEPEPDASGGDWSSGSDEPDASGGDWSAASEEPESSGGDWSGGSDDPEEQGGSW